MGANFIPASHDGFFRWQNDFYNRVNEKLNSFKIDAAKLKDVTAAKSKYEQAYLRASNPESANRSDRVERNERAAQYKTAIRAFVNENIRFNSSVSDYDRNYLGLTVPDTKPTPAPVPVTHPVLKIDFSQPSRHTLHIIDEEKSGRQKPGGVQQCEVWYKITDEQPGHYSELQYAGIATKSTFLIEYDSADAGKKVWYNARWLNTRGQHGPWGIYTGAIIA